MPYLIGNAVTISTTITTGTPAVAVDPSTITLTVTKPDSTVDTFAVGSLTHGGTGIYSYVYLPATAGAYRYVWTTTSPASSSEGTFYVEAVSSLIVGISDIRTHINTTGLEKTGDAELLNFAATAQAMVENITGPIVPQTFTETFDGGQVRLILSEYPVLSIASVVENSQGTASTLAELAAPYSDTTGLSYRVDYSIGTLTRWSGTMQTKWAAGLGTVTVTYTAGRAGLPADVRMAVLRLVEHLWTSQQGRGPTRGGSPDIPAAGHAMPWFVEELLQPHTKAPFIA
jgi:hypothetical protein